jgi:hypothetical protein
MLFYSTQPQKIFSHKAHKGNKDFLVFKAGGRDNFAFLFVILLFNF